MIGSALAITFGGAALPAHAQTIEEMRSELKQLREEINALKAQKAVDAKTVAANPVPDPRTAKPSPPVAATAPESSIPGGMLMPGSQTSVRLYGFAEFHALHDFRQANSPDVFSDLTFQPLDKASGAKGKTQLTAETTRLGFESSTPAGSGTFTTKAEADFYSYSKDHRNRPRLRHAYGEYQGWLIGQTWSTFADLDNFPETVDYNGPIGAPLSRRPLVRYSFGDAKTGLKVTFAAEDPDDQSGGGSANERMPQLVARIDMAFDRGAVNLRVLSHEKRSPTQTKRGFGVGIGGSFKPTDRDSFMAQYARVDGDIDQLYGSNGYAIDPDSGAITFDKNQGLVLGYAHIFSEKLRGNIAAGFNRGKTAQGAENLNNRTLQQLFFNLVYSPIKNVELGAEWMYGKRKTFSGDTGTLSRVDLMGRYSF
jgi:hypothetical protein